MKILTIKEIQIIPVRPNNGLIAFASCVINNQFYIGDIAIHTSFSRPRGYRLVYPAKVLVNGKRMNCVYPINKETAELIENSIITKYEELVEKVKKSYEKKEAQEKNAPVCPC